MKGKVCRQALSILKLADPKPGRRKRKLNQNLEMLIESQEKKVKAEEAYAVYVSLIDSCDRIIRLILRID